MHRALQHGAPAVQVGKRAVDDATEISVRAVLFEDDTAARLPDYIKLEAISRRWWLSAAGARARNGEFDAAALADMALEAGLAWPWRGRVSDRKQVEDRA